MKISKRKIIVVAGIFFVIFMTFIYWLVFAPHYRYGQTSPNGEYTIEIYEEPKRLFTALGDGSFRDAKLVLKNKWGFQISQSLTDEHFGLIFCENGIFEWDYKNDIGDSYQNDSFVWYVCGNARAGFNLKTKKFEY